MPRGVQKLEKSSGCVGQAQSQKGRIQTTCADGGSPSRRNKAGSVLTLRHGAIPARQIREAAFREPLELADVAAGYHLIINLGHARFAFGLGGLRFGELLRGLLALALAAATFWARIAATLSPSPATTCTTGRSSSGLSHRGIERAPLGGCLGQHGPVKLIHIVDRRQHLHAVGGPVAADRPVA